MTASELLLYQKNQTGFNLDGDFKIFKHLGWLFSFKANLRHTKTPLYFCLIGFSG